MAWKKRSLIFCPDGTRNWAAHSFMTPTPLEIDANRIRIYGGLRDSTGVSRIGFIDVRANDPSAIIEVCSQPALDIGQPGCFDDNGVILGDVIRRDDQIWMYYVGFQLPSKAKFLAYTGLAISADGGTTFKRARQAPVMDRTDEALTIRALHSIIREGNIWRAWYAAGSSWELINGRPFPRYEIRMTESIDGIHFPDAGELCLRGLGNEYRIGRPRVRKTDNGYEMKFTYGTTNGDYIVGTASSADKHHWQRGANLGLPLSQSGWDSEMICYPAELHSHGRRFLFYNGNGMGATGVGYAEWEDSL